MEMISFGLRSLKIGDIDPVTGLGTNMVSIGDVYKDTCDLIESDPQKFPHFSEQNPTNAVKIFTQAGEEVLKFSLMSTSSASLATVLGGTVTTLDTVTTWNKPAANTDIEKFVELITVDGTKIVYPRASMTGKRNYQIRANGINLIDVFMTPMQPLVAGLAAVMQTDSTE